MKGRLWADGGLVTLVLKARVGAEKNSACCEWVLREIVRQLAGAVFKQQICADL